MEQVEKLPSLPVLLAKFVLLLIVTVLQGLFALWLLAIVLNELFPSDTGGMLDFSPTAFYGTLTGSAACALAVFALGFRGIYRDGVKLSRARQTPAS